MSMFCDVQNIIYNSKIYYALIQFLKCKTFKSALRITMKVVEVDVSSVQYIPLKYFTNDHSKALFHLNVIYSCQQFTNIEHN